MSLAPLIAAPAVVQIHAFAAMAAFALALVQFAGVKGTRVHRVLGWAWVLLMALIATSSFWIHDLRQFGPFSAIHLLSIFTLFSLVGAVFYARRHQVRRHRHIMIAIFLGALVTAGLFTLVPGRIMHAVVFDGGEQAD